MSSHSPGLMNAKRRPIDSVMASGDKANQGGRPGAHKGDRARAERLRAALRENLKRRKSQERGRSQVDGGASHDSAGIVPDKSGD